ncbi:hypothetical protein BYT27DRAFT_7186905 [Phlegmacium glaucopus]|nr:hypothetical protein BYT27DRAFT_7186905 [Phlegmacium glaucopus]
MNDVNSPSKVMERRSTRLTARPANLAEALDDNMQVDSEYEQLPAESSSRGKKRKSREDKGRKVGPQVKKFRGKRGLLRQLVEMPLDVLFEIFGHLNPLDLLHVARTTKDLRAILMSRSSTSVWKHARSQFHDLPDCPDDLSEPQYAELLFGKFCTFCQRNLSTNVVIWKARVRCCSKCVSNQFGSFTSVYQTLYPRRLLEYIETTSYVKFRNRGARENTIYPLQLHWRWEEEYKALQTTSDKADWVTQKIEERKSINAHAKLCEKWVESVKQAEEMEKTALIDHRKATIMERVKTLGWADELSKMGPYDHGLEKDPFIERTCQKEITDRVLPHVDIFINTFMEATKARRLRKERDTILQQRLPILRKIYDTCVSTYPVNSIIPSCADVYYDPFVQNLVTTPPLNATFTDEDLAAVGTAFPDIVLRWRKQTEEKLLNMINQGYDIQNADESILQLATTVFSCRHCANEPLTYPRVLIHHCATDRPSYHDSLDEDLPQIRRFLHCSNWNLGNIITFETKEIAALTEVINLCGLDPKSATAEDLDKQNAIFECLTCNDVRKGRYTLSWLGVFAHQRYHSQPVQTELTLKLLDDENAAKVRDRIAEAFSRRRAERGYNGLLCTHCKQRGDIVTLAEHVKEKHEKSEPTNEDIVPALDRNYFRAEHWLWPPRPVAGIPDLTIV